MLVCPADRLMASFFCGTYRESRTTWWRLDGQLDVTCRVGFPLSPQLRITHPERRYANPVRPFKNPAFTGPLLFGKARPWCDPRFLAPAKSPPPPVCTETWMDRDTLSDRAGPTWHFSGCKPTRFASVERSFARSLHPSQPQRISTCLYAVV